MYDKNTDKTYARAQFKLGNIGGTLLELTAPAEVRFNDDVLDYKPGFIFYEKEYAGKVASGTFNYKDAEGVTYRAMQSLIFRRLIFLRLLQP